MKADCVTYVGTRCKGTGLLTVDGLAILPSRSRKVWDHSTEFNWGYGGSGPAQLALAILLDFTDDPKLAIARNQEFKWDVIAQFDQLSAWTLTGAQIRAWLALPANPQAEAAAP